MPHLAQEIYDSIIFALDDVASVKQCSLVCRSFSVTSQKHLFTNISLGRRLRSILPQSRFEGLYDGWICVEGSIEALGRLLRESPFLGKHVRQLQSHLAMEDLDDIPLLQHLLELEVLPHLSNVVSFVMDVGSPLYAALTKLPPLVPNSMPKPFLLSLKYAVVKGYLPRQKRLNRYPQCIQDGKLNALLQYRPQVSIKCVNLQGSHSPWLIPLKRDRFKNSFDKFCVTNGFILDPAILTINQRQIDLYALHTEVMAEGGELNADTNDSWSIIGARIGYIDHPESTQSTVGAAIEIRQAYKLYLSNFDGIYIKSLERAFGYSETSLNITPGVFSTLSAYSLQPTCVLRQLFRGDERVVQYIEKNRFQLFRYRQEQLDVIPPPPHAAQQTVGGRPGMPPVLPPDHHVIKSHIRVMVNAVPRVKSQYQAKLNRVPLSPLPTEDSPQFKATLKQLLELGFEFERRPEAYSYIYMNNMPVWRKITTMTVLIRHQDHLLRSPYPRCLMGLERLSSLMQELSMVFKQFMTFMNVIQESQQRRHEQNLYLTSNQPLAGGCSNPTAESAAHAKASATPSSDSKQPREEEAVSDESKAASSSSPNPTRISDPKGRDRFC